jgi:MFS family permease
MGTRTPPVRDSAIGGVPASTVRRLMIYFGLVYFGQGIGQAGGLISQPLMYYLKSLGLTTDQVAALLAVLTVPWVIKPVYGLVSDFVPLFGYRRKSYLFLMNGLAAAGFLWLTGLTAPSMIVLALFLTALGIASSDVLVDALMVENGQKTGMIKQFQSQQWMWFHIAAITSGLVGGWLSQVLAPASALHTAAFVIASAPAAVVLATAFLVREEKSLLDLGALRSSTRGLMSSLKSRTLWIVAGFLAFWNFTPSFGTPLFYHMVDHLKFEQYFIGQLTAIASVGAVIGAFVYRTVLAGRYSTKSLVYFSIFLGSGTTLAYLLLLGKTSAVVLYFTTGILSMIPLLTLLSLAAAACPPQAAGFTFAALMSIYNAAGQLSQITGAFLYERLFHQQIRPLILLAAVCTLGAFLIAPYLPDTDRTSGKAVGAKGGARPL